MALALFDLDSTLLDGDSDYLWGRFLCRIGEVDAANGGTDARSQRVHLDGFVGGYVGHEHGFLIARVTRLPESMKRRGRLV